LVDALDILMWGKFSPKWFKNLLINTSPGDEFTVTAIQAIWIVKHANSAMKDAEDKT